MPVTRLRGKAILKRIRNWIRRWWYREGRTLSRLIARDIRRDILIVSAAKVDDGIIVGRVRTTNLLYLYNGLVPESDFEPARELQIQEMWRWSGKSWGGLPDGTSIVDRIVAECDSDESGSTADCEDGGLRHQTTAWSHIMDSIQELDPELAAFVDDLRAPGESIWSWNRAEDGAVTVYLIEHCRIAQAERMVEAGLAGGEGRSLALRKEGDGWGLVGQGRWIG